MNDLWKILPQSTLVRFALCASWAALAQIIFFAFDISKRYTGDDLDLDRHRFVYAQMQPLLPMIIAVSLIIAFVIMGVLMSPKGDSITLDNLYEERPLREYLPTLAWLLPPLAVGIAVLVTQSATLVSFQLVMLAFAAQRGWTRHFTKHLSAPTGDTDSSPTQQSRWRWLDGLQRTPRGGSGVL